MRNNRLYLTSMLALIMALGVGGLAPRAGAEDAPQLKMVYLNVAQAFDAYTRTIDADRQLASKGAAKEKERQQFIDEIKKLRAGLDMLSDEARDSRQRQLEGKARSLRQFEEVTETELRGDRDAMARDILREIKRALQQYAQQQGYDIVLNQNAIVYGTAPYDMTDEFTAWLNKEFKP